MNTLAGRWRVAPSIQRYDVGRNTLMQMIAQDFGVSIATEATSMMRTPGVVFRPFHDGPRANPFPGRRSPYNQTQTLRHLLDFARELTRSVETADKSAAIE